MAGNNNNKEEMPSPLKSTSSPNKENAAAEAPNNKNPSSSSSKAQQQSPQDFILSVASNISSQPLQNFDHNVWAVLTAISNNARKRHQIDSCVVSGNHCKIYRKRPGADGDVSVFLKDTSTNGTYLNWEKLKKNDPEARIQHGDIVSFAAPPHHELAFAFVYREVARSTFLTEGSVTKRKAEEFVSESKRLKGIGIGAPEGPLSLDDFKSLQRSN